MSNKTQPQQAGVGGSPEPVIVVGVNGSDTARAAADRAAVIAAALGARLHLVSAVKASPSSVVRSGGDTWFLDDAAETQTQLVDLAKGWTELQVTTACPSGKPAEAIVAEAEHAHAELIVVGNKRMQGLSRVLGVVAAEVAHHAPCDVLIVKTIR